MRRSFGQLVKVKAGIAVVCPASVATSASVAGLRSAVCQEATSAQSTISTPACDCHKVGHIAGTGGVVRVQMNRNAHIFLELFDQAEYALYGSKRFAISLMQMTSAPIFSSVHRQLHEVILVVNGADGVADSGLAYAAVFFTDFIACLHIARCR